MLRHQSVMMRETCDALNVKAGGIYVDATFGRGGHSQEILKRLNEGQLVVFDKDPVACECARTMALSDPRLSVVHACFSELFDRLAALGIHQIDGLLLDLGVSSPMLDDPARGFSFRSDGPLDMRMDPRCSLTAEQVVMHSSEALLADIFFRYGEERRARSIARAIVAERTQRPFRTTRDLAGYLEELLPGYPHKHPATRVFQALRIYVNGEMEALERILHDAMRILRPGGRLVVLSFHSLEDRMVKHFMLEHSKPQHPRGLPVVGDIPVKLQVFKKQLPSGAEIAQNVRARSAVLRVAQRLDA